MSKYLTPGVITGALSAAALVASFAGKPALAAFLSDPATVQNVLAVVGTVGTLVAGALSGIKRDA
jgi:hypothetical protein